VRTVAVAGPQLRNAKKLHKYLSLVPSKGMKKRSSHVAARAAAKSLSVRNAEPLVLRQDPGRHEWLCTLGL